MIKKTACQCSCSVGTTCSCTGCDCKHHAPVYRWIMYLYAPGGLGFDVQRVTSLEAAKAALIQYGKDTGFYQDLTVYGDYGPTGTLYPYSEDDWAEAERMRDAGNPFDYPSYEVKSGPRGGVRVIPA